MAFHPVLSSDYDYLNTQQLFELGWEGLKSTYQGSSNPADSANAAQLATQNLIKNGFHYNPFGPGFPNPVGTDGKLVSGANLLWNDNWTKALETKNAARKDVNLGISGGSDKSRYFFSAGYLNQDGYIAKSNYERISARLNYTTDLTNWLQLGARTSIISSKQNYPDQGYRQLFQTWCNMEEQCLQFSQFLPGMTMARSLKMLKEILYTILENPIQTEK